MAFGPEELERRRKQREELQAKREQEQRALIKKLIIAGGVLAAAAIVIVAAVLIGKGGEKPRESQPAEETTAAPQETTPKQDETVIHFAAAGDLNVTDKVVASGGNTLDYAPVIADVLPVLAEADLTVLNFEGNFVGAPYGTATSSAPTQMLTALSAAGVDMLQIANSRTISNGITGLSTTLNTIRANGLEPLGAYATNEAFEENGGYTIWEVNGVRVAVVAFTKGMDNMALPTGSEKCVNVLYTDYSSKYVEVDTEGITAILERVNKESPDVVIALVHWGSEYNDTHSASQETIRKLLLNNGVDAVIGTHSHYVQEIEFDKKNGTVVAYSLGDFLGDGERAGTEYSIVLNLEITKNNKTGEAKITGYSYTPIYTYQQEDGALRVVRLDSAIAAYESGYIDRVSQEVYESMVYARERIEDRVTP